MHVEHGVDFSKMAGLLTIATGGGRAWFPCAAMVIIALVSPGSLSSLIVPEESLVRCIMPHKKETSVPDLGTEYRVRPL